MEIKTKESWGPGFLTMPDGRRMQTMTLVHSYDDWREYQADGLGHVRINFGKVWFGPTQWFISGPDGVMRRCAPLVELRYREPRKPWWRRLFS